MALVVLLSLTALLYCWGLDLNGWANSYYSAAVMAGSQDWTAFFYGSSDPSNAITVDKPPMSIWVMALSVRLFGLSSWSILLPQALMGVVTVYLLYVVVRRYLGAPVGLLAAAFMAVTPVSTVMFRYNNPDALLILIMMGVAFAVLRSVDQNRPAWLVLGGALIGAGFLTKQLQILLILPAFFATGILFGRTTWRKSLLYMMLGGLSAIAVAGSWLITVQLTDPTRRPFIGGSVNNSAIELALGYNGLDRLTGEAANRPLADAVDAVDAEQLTSGYLRFLEPGFTGQIGWFLPLALAGLAIAILRLVRRRVEPREATLLLFMTTWLLTSLTVVAFMSGIVHPYYTLTLAPPLVALAAIALLTLIRTRHQWRSRCLLALTTLTTMILCYVSATRSSSDFPWLPQLVLVVWAVTIALQLMPARAPHMAMISTISLTAALISGPILWSINTVLNPHIGAGVIAGPSINGTRTDHPDRRRFGLDVPPGFDALMLGDAPSSDLLEIVAGSTATSKWASAMVGSETAANYQLELQRPVLAVGGFNGTDPFPTLAQFKKLVSNREVPSFIVQNLPVTLEVRESEAARIVQWVRSNYSVQMIDKTEYYDLTQQHTR